MHDLQSYIMIASPFVIGASIVAAMRVEISYIKRDLSQIRKTMEKIEKRLQL